jgi:Ig-like domain-containing protein
MKKFLLTAFVATLGAVSLRAQVSANLSDVVLGFRATGGTGQNVNLEVDLGSVAQFQNQPAGTTLSISRLLAADLAAVYGANWATRSDLFWGIVGTTGRISGGPNGAPVATVWATRAQDTVGTQSLPWPAGSRDAQFNVSAQIEALLFGAPASLNGATGGSNAYSASLNGTVAGSYTYQDTFQPGNSFSYFNPTIDNPVKPASGTSSVSDLYEVRVGAGTGTYLGTFGLSTSGTLTFSTSPSFFGSSNGAPTITTQPAAQTILAGAPVTFTVAASGSGTLTYQWLKAGVAIPGATSSSYTIAAVSASDAADYSVRVTNTAGSITSTGFALTVGAGANPGRLVNLSVLTAIAPAEQLQFGFFVGGANTSGNKPLLMRAVGPSLTTFGLTGLLPDPVMGFFASGVKVTQNAGWNGDSTILTTAAAVGAFPYVSATSKDSAIYLSAVPLGTDSVVVTGGTQASTGSVIAELYDATPSSQFTATTPRLTNVSLIKNVGNLITVGFVVGGSSNLKVIVRAVGPGLAAAPFNVPGTIADPKLTLFSSGVVVASNDDWSTGTANLAKASDFTGVGAFALAPGSKDAAILVSLPPGTYQAQVTPSTGATGTALVEVYEVP